MLWLLLVPVLAGASSVSRAARSGTTSLWHFTSLQQSWRLLWWRWGGAYVGNWVNLWVAGGQCSHLVTLFSPTHPRALSHHVLGVSLFGCVRNKWFLTDFSGFTCAGQWYSICAPQHIIWVILTPGGVWGMAKAAQWDHEWYRAAWEATFLLHIPTVVMALKIFKDFEQKQTQMRLISLSKAFKELQIRSYAPSCPTDLSFNFTVTNQIVN